MTELKALFIKTCLFASENQAIRRIREAVFQGEQGIDPALEWDGRDEQAVHLVAKLGDAYAGVARLREPGAASTLKLERLAVLAAYRQQGIGSEMVHTAIAYSKAQGYRHMILHAQIPTVEFYKRLGFISIGEPFAEAGIGHLKMEQELIE